MRLQQQQADMLARKVATTTPIGYGPFEDEEEGSMP